MDENTTNEKEYAIGIVFKSKKGVWVLQKYGNEPTMDKHYGDMGLVKLKRQGDKWEIIEDKK